MARFEAAARKASGPAPAKAPVSKAAMPKAASSTTKGPAPKLNTLEDKKKFVKTHESKIDDVAEEVKNEPNKGKKKELEANLKKLQQDEHYLKAVADIKEAAAQAKRDAERAALQADTKASAGKEKEEKKAAKVDREVVADEATFKEIDAAFDGSGKDAQAAKIDAVAKLEGLAAATPFVLSRLSKLIALFPDSKLGGPSIKAACSIVSHMKPEAHGVALLVMPALLAGMEDKRWKVKAGCIDVLSKCLPQMAETTPGQLASCLPDVVAKLAEAALEVRQEIRSATGVVLREIGGMVASPEIKKLSQDLVTALAEPTNQKHTQAVLAKMGNQTFMSLIDAASLALLMPIVARGLKERESASKKWSAQIFGSTAQLVQDVDMIRPYLKTMLPMLQEALTDPVSEVQRESAKVFGVLEQVLPDYSRAHNQPWLFGKLRGGEQGEQCGSALAIAEVFVKMDPTKASKFIPSLQAGAADPAWKVRRGFLELTDTMPLAMKMEFVPYIQALFPAMLMGINGDKDQTEDPGHRAALSLVQRFGDLCPELLLPAFEGTYAAALNHESPEERARQQVVRERSATLVGKVVEKILEHKKFGQDLLTTDDCSTKDTRERLLCEVFLMRYDQDAGVKRVSNSAWKTAGGAPKVQKTIMPSMEKLLLRLRSGERGLGAQQLACEVIDELVKSGDLEAPSDEMPEAQKMQYPPVTAQDDADTATIVQGKAPAHKADEASDDEEAIPGHHHAVEAARRALESDKEFAQLPADVKNHCCAVATSCIDEGRKRVGGRRSTGVEIAAKLSELFAEIFMISGDAAKALKDKAPLSAEAVVRAALGEVLFERQSSHTGGDDEVLLRVDSLLLMYGAGHLLLKDTPLEMRKNHRYGVVGHNGAGKTTLMKEIAAHKVVGMPEHLKCVHVDDSKLGEMSKSSLSALEYTMKMAKDIGVTNAGRDTLLGVGFPESGLEQPVAELSTGWRMRLTLAVSMLKHADLVLLDEPTNHLDEESVQWLSQYILSINESSVMVISHEPKFLNKICTHVIAYVDKKLEYTEGNFDVFAMKKGLTKEQLDKMLSGNLSFDTKTEDEEGEEEGGEAKAAKVAAPIAGPPKLSFPIPGTMEGVKTGSRSVLEMKNVWFRFSKDKDYLLRGCSGKLNLSSRVAICGRNGCGKSTLMTLLCSEMGPSEDKDGHHGTVDRHCNLRLAYMKQDHLKALGPFFDTSPFVYITQRFKDGFDADLQKRLIEPEDEDDANRRKALAKVHGKYGNEVGELINRSKQGNQLFYEVKWAGLDDPKQNTMEPLSKLKTMGLDKVVIACDERIAAKAAQLDQRPLTRREIVRHCEAFGIDEEMCCNRQIRGFSAGQKVRLSLAAMFWTKPHLIALDEPTNYLDVETVDALAKALTTFRGGIVMIEPKTDFVERICNEKWILEDGTLTVEKLQNGVKRRA